jgi:hypothetical protein
MSAPQQVTEGQQVKPLSLDERLRAKTAEAKEKANKLKCEVSYDQDMDELTFTCSGRDLMSSVKPSQATLKGEGTVEGLMLDLSGTFNYRTDDGSVIKAILSHMRGGGAYVGVRFESAK